MGEEEWAQSRKLDTERLIQFPDPQASFEGAVPGSRSEEADSDQTRLQRKVGVSLQARATLRAFELPIWQNNDSLKPHRRGRGNSNHDVRVYPQSRTCDR